MHAQSIHMRIEFTRRNTFNVRIATATKKFNNQSTKTSFIRFIEQKVTIWPKIQPKVSKVASSSMKIYTGITTLATVGKASVFFSYDWPSVAKNADVF